MKIGNILAHRGCWSTRSERNTPVALFAAIDEGFGVETDFRDALGRLVVSHDPPCGSGLLDAEAFFARLARPGSEGRLALNVKADGLQTMIADALGRSGLDVGRVFAFDMSIPDALGYLGEGLPIYTRTSEFEEVPSLLDRAEGLWVDDFGGVFPQIEAAIRHLAAGKRVALVSPELHGRDHRSVWDAVDAAGLHRAPLFELCTDFPREAFARFGTSK